MINFKYILLGAFLGLLAPMNAQNTKEEILDDASLQTAVSDSAMVDSLQADSIPNLPWPESVKYRIDRLLESKMFETSQVGMMVWDLSSDSCIYAHNARWLMRPASCMKLVTAITALDKLGGSYQFKTQLKYTGAIHENVIDGDVYCVGGMDPRFNNDDLSAFVSSLKELGVDTIRGNIYADNSMKDANPYGEGWCWDDKNYTLTPLLLGRKDQFMSRFISKLREVGIYYAGYGSSEKRCPSDAFLITTRTHSIDQILTRMMKESDNLYAESMYYQIAASTGNRPASARSARSVERQLISKIGLDDGRYKLADGSGLSLYNYVSPELLVRLLRYAYQNENIYNHLRSALPIAGVDGTLKKRMRGTFAQDNVHAKTGTVTGIISLAGYCKASNNHMLCFAIINQGIMHGSNARAFQDRVCNALCQPQ
jgi:D-alanyl-D-alanine carboxypeptidase/D-alanyl-D-alanine-endopeptidase (penicillin-binding protein 4)